MVYMTHVVPAKGAAKRGVSVQRDFGSSLGWCHRPGQDLQDLCGRCSSFKASSFNIGVELLVVLKAIVIMISPAAFNKGSMNGAEQSWICSWRS